VPPTYADAGSKLAFFADERMAGDNSGDSSGSMSKGRSGRNRTPPHSRVSAAPRAAPAVAGSSQPAWRSVVMAGSPIRPLPREMAAGRA
jgi:hypothetical protein